jgi:hypothetical protein
MEKYLIKTIWAVVIWADPNMGWGSQDLYLVNSKKLADKIADGIEPMDGARVEKRVLITGERE